MNHLITDESDIDIAIILKDVKIQSLPDNFEPKGTYVI